MLNSLMQGTNCNGYDLMKKQITIRIQNKTVPWQGMFQTVL